MHPDKGGDASAFAQLKTAFETVSDPLKLQQWQHGQGGGAAAVESVDIECMAYDGARRSFTHACRCGGVFEAPESMLDLRWVARAQAARRVTFTAAVRFDTFQCATCSCALRVLYSPAAGAGAGATAAAASE
jgi:hypothetical protein